MKLIYLPKDDNIIRTLATWFYNEWLYSNPNASVDKMVSVLSSRVDSNKVPITIVAIDDNGEPIGAGSLTVSDMKSRTDLSPWMGGIYVSESARGKGVGSSICIRIAEEAKRLGYSKIYLFTKDQDPLYSRLGWKTISVEDYNGMEVTVMELEIV